MKGVLNKIKIKCRFDSFVLSSKLGVTFVLATFLFACEDANVANVNIRAITPSGDLVSDVDLEFYIDGKIQKDLSVQIDESATIKLDAAQDYSVKVNAEGYAVQIVPFTSAPADATSNLTLTLIERGDVISITDVGDFDKQGQDGASVSFNSADFVDENGNSLDEIQLTITPVDVSSPTTLAGFPGDFLGLVQDTGEETSIISFGSVEYHFTSAGKKVELKAGASAEVLIPIYISTYQDGTAIKIGDEIPLWSLTESTGVWQQEATGKVVTLSDSPTGLAMQATVSHFSWWNANISMKLATLEVTAIAELEGSATLKATTEGIAWELGSVNSTLAINEKNSDLVLPANIETCLWVEAQLIDGKEVVTRKQCLTPEADEHLSLTFDVAGDSNEPLDVVANPGDDSDIVNVTSHIESSIARITIAPLSLESSVSYEWTSGQLPEGVSFREISVTSLEIFGRPSVAGSFNATLLATDNEGNTDTIEFNFEIKDQVVLPKIIPVFDELFEADENKEIHIDLKNYNEGGLASNWALNTALPAGFSLSPSTGILSVDLNQLGSENLLQVCLQQIEMCGFLYNSFLTVNNISGQSKVWLEIAFESEIPNDDIHNSDINFLSLFIYEYHDDQDIDDDGLTNKEEIEGGSYDVCVVGKACYPVPPSSPTNHHTDSNYSNYYSYNDGLSDGKEAEIGTDPTKADTDGDGVNDSLEVIKGSDPLDPNSYPFANLTDWDEDGIPNELDQGEYLSPDFERGYLDALKTDSDHDGVLDGDEDSDFDGLINKDEVAYGTGLFNPDTDDDGATDKEEIDAGTDPLDAASKP